MRDTLYTFRLIALMCTVIAIISHLPGGAWAQVSCDQIGASVRICGVSAAWRRTTLSPYAAIEYTKENEFHAQVISEPSGTRDGLSLSQVTEVLIDDMESRVDRGSLEVLVRGRNAGIRQSEIIVSRVQLDGIPFIFANTVYVGKSQTIQIITWRIAKILGQADRRTHLEFGNYLALMPDF